MQRAVGRVAVEHPGHAAPDLLGAGVDPAAAHAAYGAPIAVAPSTLDDGLLAEAKAGKGLLRALSEWLPLFRGIYLGQPNNDLLLLAMWRACCGKCVAV